MVKSGNYLERERTHFESFFSAPPVFNPGLNLNKNIIIIIITLWITHLGFRTTDSTFGEFEEGEHEAREGRIHAHSFVLF